MRKSNSKERYITYIYLCTLYSRFKVLIQPWYTFGESILEIKTNAKGDKANITIR